MSLTVQDAVNLKFGPKLWLPYLLECLPSTELTTDTLGRPDSARLSRRIRSALVRHRFDMGVCFLSR